MSDHRAATHVSVSLSVCLSVCLCGFAPIASGNFLVKMLTELNSGNQKTAEHVRVHLYVGAAANVALASVTDTHTRWMAADAWPPRHIEQAAIPRLDARHQCPEH